LNWLRPPSESGPAATLRWVRRIELAFVPFAIVLGALALAKGSDLWWVGFASAALGLVAAAPMGPMIRRAEERTALHPERWRDWRRRADRLTGATFAALATAAVVIAFVFAGAGLAVALGAMFLAASAAASAVHRRVG
jgi:predicted branched-subunit amino acid permease